MGGCVYGSHAAYVSFGVAWFVQEEFRKPLSLLFCSTVDGKKLVFVFVFFAESSTEREVRFWYVRLWGSLFSVFFLAILTSGTTPRYGQLKLT